MFGHRWIGGGDVEGGDYGGGCDFVGDLNSEVAGVCGV